MRTTKYNPQNIERKWHSVWEKKKTFGVNLKRAKNPYYNLMMFPYPSAEGLHVGNVYAFTGSDIHGRFKRMRGNDVFEPMGFDAFGIHSENFAIKKGIHPKTMVARSVANFRKQLKNLGCLFDWAHEVNTTDSAYYKWTQWLFLQLFKAGFAYRAKAPVDWCPSCKTVLADEQVIKGRCERCDSEVVQKELEQWFFRITKYADRLLRNLDRIDWSERTKIAQRNWIGKSEGSIIDFKIKNLKLKIPAFTTRADTLFGATYMVLAPEHELISDFRLQISNWEEVKLYIEQAKKKTELERTELEKEKTGVELKGIKAINPANGNEVPIFIADYVLRGYGTGAIMAVPMHDERDFEFAKKYEIPLKTVIVPKEKRTCLLIHGFGSSSKKDWFVWLKGVLEKEGWDVVIPDLPNSDHPIFEEWMKMLGEYTERLGDTSIIVGHSLGGFAALKMVEGLQKKIHKLILVAPTESNWRKEHIEERKKLDPTSDWDSTVRFSDRSVDYKKIESLTDEIAFFFSDDDPYIPLEVKVLYQEKIRGRFHVLSEKGHFNGKDFSEIIEEFQEPYALEGILVHSGEFSGMESQKAKPQITKFVKGKKTTQYHLRDWLISRQRYWGPPIPIIYCDICGIVPVPEKDLPVLLPYVKEFRPTGTGKSPLASVEKFVKTKCPVCKGPAKRETDVSDTFLDSSWYFLRYPSVGVKNSKLKIENLKLEIPWNQEITRQWLPVDMYIGGQEHAVLHLLYTRFVTMVLRDLKCIDFQEPFEKFRAHGLITKGGAKMSKSRGNVVNPDDYYKQYGADTLRMYLMFLGPYGEGGDWSDAGIVGITRFLNRVWELVLQYQKSNIKNQNENVKFKKNELEISRHKTIKKVTEDIENLRYNTAIAALMEYLNKISDFRFQISEYEVKTLLLLLAPFAPHITEELWQTLGHKTSIHSEEWPKWNERYLREEKVTIVVQINSRVRDQIEVQKGSSEAEVRQVAERREKVVQWMEGKDAKRVFFVQDRLINFVI